MDSAAVAMTTGLALGATELFADTVKKPAAADADDKPVGPPVTCAVIGGGPRGREILAALAKMESSHVPVAAIVDTYAAPVFVKKLSAVAPGAKILTDYRQVLSDKTIQAVFVATPSHLHKQIVLDALAAGKHVYCEAPLGATIEDAKAIATAGKAAKTIFQAGLQERANGQHLHIQKFIASGVLGSLAYGRSQWNSREKWFTQNPNVDREKELNWRLYKATSPGLMGEVGIHALDTFSWFNKGALPIAVTGFSKMAAWGDLPDKRDVPDTVQCVVQYPGDIHLLYDATLANSFEGTYENFYGTACAIHLRDQRGWMFKENDSKALGWETFARRDEMVIGDPKAHTGISIGSGIALVANATKQLSLGIEPGAVGTDVSKTALYQSLLAFVNSVNSKKAPNAGALEGYQATVVALKCNDAANTQSTIKFQPEWFTLS